MSLSNNILFHKSKNRILYYVLFFIISSISLTAQNFQLASNNKTVTCDGASFGQTGVVGGKTYTKVNRNTLISMISGGKMYPVYVLLELLTCKVYFKIIRLLIKTSVVGTPQM